MTAFLALAYLCSTVYYAVRWPYDKVKELIGW